MKRHSAAKKSEWPRTVKVGATAVKVYRQERNGTPYFYVADYSGGARKMRSFPSEDTALAEAGRLARLIATGDSVAARFAGKDAASYARALELLAPIGVPVELAIASFVRAFEILKSDRLAEAAEFYVRNNSENLPQRTVAEVAAELLDQREHRRASERYLGDLRNRLAKISAAFACPIASVTTADVQNWLDGLRLAPQTVKNFRTIAGTLFSFAESRGYIHKGSSPVANTEMVSASTADAIAIYTPSELARLLAAAPVDFLPALAICAFCGLRSAEVQRLDWQAVDVAGGFITIGADKAKTKSRRLVPICASLAQWLAPYAQTEGKVWPLSGSLFHKRSASTAAAAGIEWKDNGLRHSFCSYRLAVVQSAAQVALEAGNSPKVVFQHYRELVKPDAAVAWFNIMPSTAANIVSIKAAA